MKRSLALLAIAVAMVASLFPPAHGALAAGVGIRSIMTFKSIRDEGLAVLDSRYAYVGTSTANTLRILDARSLGTLANWHLPGALGYDMTRMRLSRNNHWLYVMNQIRTDVVKIDVTGKTSPLDLNIYPQHNGIPTDIKVSRDGRILYVMGGAGADRYDTSNGTYLGRIQGADAVAPASKGLVYFLTIRRGQASVHVQLANGSTRVLASYGGNSLSDLNGDIALSPDGRVVYALWDSFRAFNASNGRQLGAVALPLVPHFNGIALSPNGRQAMLWAPHFVSIVDTPGINPGQILRTYGFIAGGLLPIDLTRMRPIQAHLERVHNPHQVAYTSDSRSAFVTGQNMLAVISTGIEGTDHATVPPISLRNPGGASGTTQPSGGNSGNGGTTKSVSCNVTGSWSFVSSAAGAGPGSGNASLSQSGSSVTGSLNTGAVVWSLSGSISHRTLTLTMRAPGQIDLSYSGTVSTSATTIAGNLGNFTNGRASCK